MTWTHIGGAMTSRTGPQALARACRAAYTVCGGRAAVTSLDEREERARQLVVEVGFAAPVDLDAAGEVDEEPVGRA